MLRYARNRAPRYPFRGHNHPSSLLPRLRARLQLNTPVRGEKPRQMKHPPDNPTPDMDYATKRRCCKKKQKNAPLPPRCLSPHVPEYPPAKTLNRQLATRKPTARVHTNPPGCRAAAPDPAATLYHAPYPPPLLPWGWRGAFGAGAIVHIEEPNACAGSTRCVVVSPHPTPPLVVGTPEEAPPCPCGCPCGCPCPWPPPPAPAGGCWRLASP